MEVQTAEQAWELVADNVGIITAATRKSPRIEGVSFEELQSYAVESAFRAAKTWDPELSSIEARMYGAARTGAIDGLREMSKFYGWRKNSDRMTIAPVPDDDLLFWELASTEVSSDDVDAYLSLMDLIEPLTERERSVAFLLFSERWTPKEIGEYYGVSGNAISQSKASLIAKLRQVVAPPV